MRLDTIDRDIAHIKLLESENRLDRADGVLGLMDSMDKSVGHWASTALQI